MCWCILPALLCGFRKKALMRYLIPIFSIVLLTSSCVSSRIHQELQTKYKDLEGQNESLMAENDKLQTQLGEANSTIRSLKNQLVETKKQAEEATERYQSLLDKYQQLNKNYEFLLESNNALLSSNQAENRKLMEKLSNLQMELSAKEDSLRSEQDQMDYLSAELQKREARVNELENLIAQQKLQVDEVRKTLKEALFNFDGKGLSVEQRDGKIYVSLENSLLFPSGSWSVNKKGREALDQLATVLAQNPDLNVMVEGHTDSDPFNSSSAVKDNWDLSVMRATAIVKILTETSGVNPKKITAAGRSEFVPIAPNTNKSGKAKNRRTEIIITPDLGEIMKVLGEVNSEAN